MARPQRNDVDYFPFYCKQGGSTDYIETAYGNDGFAVWVKILRELATTNFHYLNLSSRQKAMTFSSKCKVSEEMLYKIIADLVELGEFDADLWNENRIVWSSKFIESIGDAYKKRSNKILKRSELISMLEGLGIRKPISNGVNSPVNPQRKEEYSKEEESIANTPAQNFEYELVDENVPCGGKTEIFESIFTDEIFISDLARNFPGANLEKAFSDCWLYHSQKPSPPELGWQWRQKLTTWLSIDEQKKKQPNASIKRTSGQTSPEPGKDYATGF